MDILIRRARLHSGRVVDIGMEDGIVAALEPGITTSARLELDAHERLTIPAFVNGHLHACKSFWRRPLGMLSVGKGFDFTDAGARFSAIAEVKRQYTVEDVLDRAEETIKLALKNGTCAVRLFADVDNDAGLRALDGLLRVRDRYRNTLKVQVVAFPQNGVFHHRSSTESLLRQALEMSVDALGGIPWLEPTEDAQRAHVDLVLELAQARNLDAHFVLDDTEDPTSRTIDYVAARTIVLGLQGRVHGTQANALSYYDDAHAARVIRLVRDSGMTIFSNAHVALVTSGGSRRQPAPRGMTRVRELLAAGVPVATAQDDIDNPYYAFGRNDLLEVAQFMAHLGPFAWGADVDRVLEMVTTVPAGVMRLEGYGLELGSRANVLVLDAPTWRDALQFQVAKSLVIVNGRLVAREERKQELYV
jgi:cytosine deaminase